MNEKELSDLLEFSDDGSLLIVNRRGGLQELTCPFKVQVLHDIGTLSKGEEKAVEAVKLTIQIITVYIIDQKAYYYYHFELLTSSS